MNCLYCGAALNAAGCCVNYLCTRPNPFLPFVITVPPVGWTCPSCGIGVAPWQMYCPICRPRTQTQVIQATAPTNTATPSPEAPPKV